MFYLCFVRLSYLELTSYFLSQAKRVVLYLGRAQPVKTLDELMVELQTVETLNCMIERTETPPFYRQVKHQDHNHKCSKTVIKDSYSLPISRKIVKTVMSMNIDNHLFAKRIIFLEI